MKILKLGPESVDRLPYSSGLAFRHVFLLFKLTVLLRKQRVPFDKKAITFINTCFAGQHANYYWDGLKRQKHHWKSVWTYSKTTLKNKTAFNKNKVISAIS